MGNGKSVDSIGEYHFYTPDAHRFAEEIARRFSCNIKLSFADMTDGGRLGERPDEYLDFGHGVDARMSYWQGDYERKRAPGLLSCSYDLYLPDAFRYSEALDFEFFENGLFTLDFLEYDSLWRSFIDRIRGRHEWERRPRVEVIEDLQAVRAHYLPFYRMLDCYEVTLRTDYPYGTIERFLFSQAPGMRNTLAEVRQSFVEADGVQLFDFCAALQEPGLIPERLDPYRVVLSDHWD
ncbi:hypothetical protein [Flaviaesturariibacter amylovorans]|uniref:Uncharacterized protein n=1 Tax=Flaviaesturariibacter amylovorans TaxID=1084520 RepID=A0ABP8HR76_9BACT